MTITESLPSLRPDDSWKRDTLDLLLGWPSRKRTNIPYDSRAHLDVRANKRLIDRV
jgi:hypothetical protein